MTDANTPVSDFNAHHWKTVAGLMGTGRDHRAYRRRWMSLNPAVQYGPWTPGTCLNIYIYVT